MMRSTGCQCSLIIAKFIFDLGEGKYDFLELVIELLLLNTLEAFNLSKGLGAQIDSLIAIVNGPLITFLSFS